MTVDWGSLVLVSLTTVLATVGVVGVVTAGVAALSVGTGKGGTAGRRLGARAIGWVCLGVAGLLVLFGLYLIVPMFR